jgi:hypothetical protein
VFHGDSLSGVLHFDYDSWQWRYTTDNNGHWQTQAVGVHGDGFHLFGATFRGSSHLVFTSQRFSSDRSPPQYGHWDKGLTHREVIDPSLALATAITVGTDGQPIILANQFTQYSDQSQVLAFRRSSGWQLQPVTPKSSFVGRSSACDARGRIHLVGQNPRNCQLVHWMFDNHQWQAALIDDSLTHQADWAVLQLDARDQPVVLACLTEHDHSQVLVNRPYEDQR